MLKVSAMYLSSAASEARKSVRRIIPPCTLLYSLRTKDATESSTISLMFFWMMSSSTLCSLKQQKHSRLKLLSHRQFFICISFTTLMPLCTALNCDECEVLTKDIFIQTPQSGPTKTQLHLSLQPSRQKHIRYSNATAIYNKEHEVLAK